MVKLLHVVPASPRSADELLAGADFGVAIARFKNARPTGRWIRADARTLLWQWRCETAGGEGASGEKPQLAA